MQKTHTTEGGLRGRALSILTRTAVFTAGMALCATGAASPNQSSQKQLAGMHAKPRVQHSSVIVTFQAQPTPSQLSRLKALGFDLTRHLEIVKAVAGNVRDDRISQIYTIKGVKQVTDDQGVRKTDAFTVNSSLAGAAYTQYGSLGTGIGVAVLDSGVGNIADFGALPGMSGGSRLKANVDFTGLGPADQCGHGTHVAGIIAGDGNKSTGTNYTQTFYGVAPGASLINIRVLGKDGSGTVSNVIAGVQWVIANKAKYNIRVLNISMGHPVTQSYKNDPLCQAVEQAWKAGIVVVCAAGNGGRANDSTTPGLDNEGFGTAYGSIECPGNDPYVITVGATKSLNGNRSDDRIATYSSRGPTDGDIVLKPDIVAPGNRVVSTENVGTLYLIQSYTVAVEINKSLYCTSGKLTDWSKDYMMLSGTSMAAPVVSGAVAMMLAKQPTLTPDTVKARLMVSADKWTQPDGTGDACTFGAGYLNVQAAMASTIVATTPALSPTLTQPTSGKWYVNLDPSVYGNRAMWGTGITNLSSIYGSDAIYGSSTTQLKSGRAMWGTGFLQLNASWLGRVSNMDCTGNAILVNGE
ncbi:MAG TPA: S8 family peptidase [Fimbriimonas sp.]|nr:S8 family peptidase [Fimbriimonas sp.]